MKDTALSGMWWRWSKYEVRDGYVRRAAGATLDPYLPLDQHGSERGRRGREQAPFYASLIELSDNLSHGVSGEPDAESNAAIANWCNQHGLLGVLLHQVQEVRFAPRWKRAQPASPSARRLARNVLQALPAALSGERACARPAVPDMRGSGCTYPRSFIRAVAKRAPSPTYSTRVPS